MESLLLFLDVVVYASALIFSVFGWQRFLLTIDKHYYLKRSKRNIWIFFVAGLVSPFPIHLMHPIWYIVASFLGVDQNGVGKGLSEFAYGIMVTGPMEELVKFSFFFAIAKIFKTFHEPKDAMLQCATVALGFSVTENIIYANDYGAYNMAYRSILCSVGHMVYTSIVGYFYGLLSYNKLSHRGIHPERLAFLAILPAAFLHGTYNFFTQYGLYYGIFVDLIGMVIVYRLYTHLLHLSPYRKFKRHEAKEGIETIKKSLRYHENNSFLLKRLGLFHFPLQKYSEALNILNDSLKHNPKDKITAVYKAVAYFGLGEKEKGEDQLRAHQPTIDKHHKSLKQDIKEYITDPALKAELMVRFEPTKKEPAPKAVEQISIRKQKKKK
jgi:RsiW-degrading membrane proteinase PrsW (M82 family)